MLIGGRQKWIGREAFKEKLGINNKTEISVLPNDTGEIKTKFRISKKGSNGTTIWYYPLLKLPANNTSNYASAIISGRIGGWGVSTMSYINALVWNRDTPGISFIDITGKAGAMSQIWNVADLVLYVNSDATASLYIKCKRIFCI